MAIKKTFKDHQDGVVKELVEGAKIHKDTHHIEFSIPKLPETLTMDNIKETINFINGTTLAVQAATAEIGHNQYPESKIEAWDGRLEMFDGLSISSDVRLREEVGEETVYGTSQTFVSYPHSQEMVTWFADLQTTNQERIKKLFD